MVCEFTHLVQPLTFQVKSNKKEPFPGTIFFVKTEEPITGGGGDSFSSITSSLFEKGRRFCTILFLTLSQNDSYTFWPRTDTS